MGKIKITSSNMAKVVEQTFEKCLFEEDEDKTNFVLVEGITHKFGLHPKRLEEQREIVKEILSELPEEFNLELGHSFLMLCYNKLGEVWTGEHRICEELIVMAIGLGLMDYSFPKEMWNNLPGGMPYVRVK